MHSYIVALLVVAMLCLALGYFIHTRIKIKKMRLRLQKLYGSQLYIDMKPMLRSAKRYLVDDLVIDKTGVVWKYYQMAGAESGFLMHSNGYDYLSYEQQEAMRALLQDQIPKLADSKCYRISKRSHNLVNGKKEYYYCYNMTSEYKSSLSRYAYYDGTLQPHSW